MTTSKKVKTLLLVMRPDNHLVDTPVFPMIVHELEAYCQSTHTIRRHPSEHWAIDKIKFAVRAELPTREFSLCTSLILWISCYVVFAFALSIFCSQLQYPSTHFLRECRHEAIPLPVHQGSSEARRTTPKKRGPA